MAPKKKQQLSNSELRRAREKVQDKLWDIADAIIDSKKFISSYGIIHFTQHGDASNFSAYLLLSTGELDEERYDVLRAIVNEHGGKLSVLESREDRNYNVRVWPVA